MGTHHHQAGRQKTKATDVYKTIHVTTGQKKSCDGRREKKNGAGKGALKREGAGRVCRNKLGLSGEVSLFVKVTLEQRLKGGEGAGTVQTFVGELCRSQTSGPKG